MQLSSRDIQQYLAHTQTNKEIVILINEIHVICKVVWNVNIYRVFNTSIAAVYSQLYKLHTSSWAKYMITVDINVQNKEN